MEVASPECYQYNIRQFAQTYPIPSHLFVFIFLLSIDEQEAHSSENCSLNYDKCWADLRHTCRLLLSSSLSLIHILPPNSTLNVRQSLLSVPFLPSWKLLGSGSWRKYKVCLEQVLDKTNRGILSHFVKLCEFNFAYQPNRWFSAASELNSHAKLVDSSRVCQLSCEFVKFILLN